METVINQWDIGLIERANIKGGFYFFSRDTMRFFKSRILEGTYEGAGGVFFVTTEKGPSGIRRATVHKFDIKTGRIDTAGPFNELSNADAKNLAVSMAAAAAKR